MASRHALPTLALTFLLLATTGVGAQTDPTPAANVLYFHVTNADGCCDYWMNNVKEDANQTIGSVGLLAVTPAADDPGMPPTEVPVLGTVSWPLGPGTLSMPLTPALTAPLLLDPAGLIEVVAWVGGAGQSLATVQGVPVPLPAAGQVDVYPLLTLGDQVVAQGEPQTAMYAEEWLQLTWSLAPQLTVLDPSLGDLVWTLAFAGAGDAIVVSASDDPGWTTLTLPVLTPPAPVVEVAQPLEAPASPSPSSSATTTTAALAAEPTLDPTSNDQATGGFPPQAGQDAPGPGPLAVLALIALAVALRRRLA